MNRRALLALALLSFGCSEGSQSDAPRGSAATNARAPSEPEVAARPRLWLTTAKEGEKSHVTVNYKRGPSAGARVAEIRIGYSDSVEFVAADAGDSVRNAEKELTTQTPQSGVVRLVVLSRDGGELGDGSIAVLHFQHRDSVSAKADLLMDKPVFAPVEAMQGLLIGDPVDL